jgi:uncharacterized delta-60 repeat protein
MRLFSSLSQLKRVAIQNGWLLFIPIVFVPSLVKAQTPGTLDNTFNPADTIYKDGLGETLSTNPIRSLCVWNNKIYGGGNFTEFNGARGLFLEMDSSSRVNRVFPLGFGITTGNITFGLDRSINSFAEQSNNGLILGGSFTKYRLWNTHTDVTVGRVARMLPNGMPDPTFNANPGLNGAANAVACASDRKIYVGGGFSQAYGQPRNNFCRLLQDGGLDVTFSIGSGFNGAVNAIKIQPDGKILVGGKFTTYQGMSHRGLIRLLSNGSVDNTFNIGSGFESGDVRAIALGADGSIVVGGNFQRFNGETQPLALKLNNNGTKRNGSIFNIDTESEVNDIVYFSNGSFVLGGIFDYQSADGDYFARSLISLDQNFEVDRQFKASINSSYNHVFALSTFQNESQLLVGGGFTCVNDTTRKALVAVHMPTGRVNNNFMKGWGFNDVVMNAIQLADSSLVFAGRFTTVNGTPMTKEMAKLDWHGNLISSFKFKSIHDFCGVGTHYNEIQIFNQEGCGILVSGLKTQYETSDSTQNNYSEKSLYRLNWHGEVDTSFNCPIRQVKKVTLLRNKKILVEPDTAFMVGMPLLHRLTKNGSRDQNFSSGVRHRIDSVLTLNVVAETRTQQIYAGFDKILHAGVRTGIKRLHANGSIDTTFKPPVFRNCRIEQLWCFRDGSVLVGFVMVGGTPPQVGERRIRGSVKLNLEGKIDTTYKADSLFPFFPNSTSHFMQNNDKLIIRGGRERLTKQGIVDLTYQPDWNQGGTSGGIGTGISALKDGKILGWGGGNRIGEIPKSKVARLHNCSPPPITPAIANTPPLICQGDTLRLEATPASINPAWTYHWQFFPDNHPEDESEIDATLDESPRVKIVPMQTGTYYLVAVSEICSTARSQPVRVTVKPLPAPPQLSGPGSVCLNSATGTPVGPSVLRVVNPESGFQYNWFAHPDSVALFTGQAWGTTMAGNYFVRSTDTDGCKSAFTPINLITSFQPNIQLFAASIDTLPVGQSMQVFVQGNAAGTATWSVHPANGGRLQPTQGDTVVFTAIAGYSGEVSIICRYSTPLGCVAEDSVRLAVLGFPASKNQSSLKVYPNPAQNFLMVENAQEGMLQVFNAQGKLMESASISQAQHSHLIKTSNWSSGVYFLKSGNHGVKVRVE